MTEKKSEAERVLETLSKNATVQMRLGALQKALKVPKGQENKFGGYKYRSCEDILEAVKPLLNVGEFVNLSDEIILIGDRYYVKATASFSFGGQSIQSHGWARESIEKKGMDSAQITGAASSYARKYSLNGLLLIDDTKDADATNDHKEESKRRSMAPMDKSGNKAVDKAVMDAIQNVKNSIDAESARHIGRNGWKFCKESGATEEQLDLIQQETENHLEYLNAKGN